MGRHVLCTEEMRNIYKILHGEAEGKRPLGIPGHKKGGF
jgi:hypothetical protein